MLDKSALLAALRDRVAADREALERRQRDAQAGSTHAESRAEHAKDTRATEQSYLARGLAERVEELARTQTALEVLQPKSFERDDPIAVTALVVLNTESDAPDATPGGERQTWWLVAGAGGFELEQRGHVVRTLTPGSPLGRALLGLQIGDEGAVRTPRGERRFEVVDVS